MPRSDTLIVERRSTMNGRKTVIKANDYGLHLRECLAAILPEILSTLEKRQEIVLDTAMRKKLLQINASPIGRLLCIAPRQSKKIIRDCGKPTVRQNINYNSQTK